MYTLNSTPNTVVYTALADTDCSIIIVDGTALAFVEDRDDDGVVGYAREIGEGEYVHNCYHGYSWLVQGGVLRSVHGEPGDMIEIDVNDGSQDIVMSGGDIADMLAI